MTRLSSCREVKKARHPSGSYRRASHIVEQVELQDPSRHFVLVAICCNEKEQKIGLSCTHIESNIVQQRF